MSFAKKGIKIPPSNAHSNKRKLINKTLILPHQRRLYVSFALQYWLRTFSYTLELQTTLTDISWSLREGLKCE